MIMLKQKQPVNYIGKIEENHLFQKNQDSDEFEPDPPNASLIDALQAHTTYETTGRNSLI